MVAEIEVVQHVHDVGGIFLVPLAEMLQNLHLPVSSMCRSLAAQLLAIIIHTSRGTTRNMKRNYGRPNWL